MRTVKLLSADEGAFQGLSRALSGAEDAVSRLDARVGSSPLAAGWRSRMACHEAVAWQWNAGEMAPLEEVVLHAARLGQQAPDAPVTAAVAALVRRRRAARSDLQDLERWDGLQSLLGRRVVVSGSRSAADEALLASVARPRPSAPGPTPPSPALPFLKLMTWPPCPLDRDEEVFALWVEEIGCFVDYPPLLQATAALDLWTFLQPVGQETDAGPLLVEKRLQSVRRLRSTPLLVELGRRALARQGRHWRAAGDPSERAIFWLDAIAAGAAAGLAELDLLAIGRQRLDQALAGRRSNSRLPALADLFLRSPVVTANMVSEELRVTAQAARLMLRELSGVVREVTGRSTYRIWRL